MAGPREDRAPPAKSDDRSGRVDTVPWLLPKGGSNRGRPRAGEESENRVPRFCLAFGGRRADVQRGDPAETHRAR